MNRQLFIHSSFIIILVTFGLFGCNLNDRSAQNKKIKNLRAFAKLYGYTRYFHPSDQADSINWNQFAIYGSQRVMDAENIQELKTDLEELFAPLAPTLRLYFSGKKPIPYPLPVDTTGLKVVAWQHLGLGRKDGLPPYRSIRTNRPAVITHWDFKTKEIFTGLLFDKIPGVSESIDKKITGNLFCFFPPALYSDSAGTLPHVDKFLLKNLRDSLENVNLYSLTADDESVRVGDIIIAWNIFQHFYSYFDVNGVDWDKELTDKLRQALTDRNGLEFYNTIRRMIADLKDGHGHVNSSYANDEADVPFLTEWIENKAVVVYAADADKVHKGDIIISVDSISSKRILETEESFISGSPQWKRYRAMQRFGTGKIGSVVDIELIRANSTLYVKETRIHHEEYSEFSQPDIFEIREGIYYVNLDKAPMDKIDSCMNELAGAKGIIFDLRGYPKGNHAVISHLLDMNDTSGSWMRIPEIIYPDRENIAGWENHGWHMPARQPHIPGKAVFITDGRAISYTESFMGFIENYKLGEIVGQPTAGSNGNATGYSLPGGFIIQWTGMKVVRHDGSQQNLIGIRPTVPVQRTIKGVNEGRDEFLDKALGVINK